MYLYFARQLGGLLVNLGAAGGVREVHGRSVV
jgi:hypothetical protein